MSWAFAHGGDVHNQLGRIRLVVDKHVGMYTRHQTALFHVVFPGWRLFLTAILMIACMIGIGWLARRSWVGIAVLTGLSIVWLTIDRLWEMMILFSITASHGVALADLVGIAGLAVSAWLGLRLRQVHLR